VGTADDTETLPLDPREPPRRLKTRLAEYAPALHRFLARRLRSRVDTDDLMQYVYLRFLQSPQHEVVRNIEGYLYRIATNVINEFALHQRREIVTYDSETADAVSEHRAQGNVWRDELVEQFANEQELEQVLAQVPIAYRRVLIAWLWEDLSHEEIGERLGLTPQTVKQYIVRGIAYCRRADWFARPGTKS
jgi:RNA polymerase sigma-70 factor (ECF subfamily)